MHNAIRLSFPRKKRRLNGGMGLILYSKEDDGSFVRLQGLGESMLPLLNLLSLSDLLHLKVQLILVLPDSKPESVHIGWKFHPRLLSYNDGDFHEVHAVMVKMFENLNLSKGEEKGR
jgi:hypothetical protein